MDKAGTQYWDAGWAVADLPMPLNLQDTSLNNYVNLQLHHYFERFLKKNPQTKVMEIGCANSIWPIYFYQQFGCQVAGLDYSEVGCEKSRQLLKNHQVPGEIHCADLFNPPAALRQQFDWVVSFGVVEHFEDTAACLKACATLLKPGGTLFTLIPNMNGVIGRLQQWVDRKVYDVHVPLTAIQLREAHEKANLPMIACDYFLALNLNVINSGHFAETRWNPLLRRMFSWISKLCWGFERLGLRIPPNRFTSPYILSIAQVGAP